MIIWSTWSFSAKLSPTNMLLLWFICEILDFQESYNLISWEHLGPELKNWNFARHGTWDGKPSITRILFPDYSQGYQVTKLKTRNALFWGPIFPFMSQFILSYWTFLNYAIWSVESTLGNNSKSEILPDMEFGKWSQVSQLSFETVFRKIKWQNFQKIQNALFSALCTQIRAKKNFQEK